MPDLARKLRDLVETDLLARARVLSDDLDRFDADRVAEEWLRVYQHALRSGCALG